VGKGKTIGIVIGAVVGGIIVLGLIGILAANVAPAVSREQDSFTDGTNVINNTQVNPVSSQSAQVNPTRVNKVDRVFVLGDESDNVYQARFSLVDANQVEISEDGEVSFAITDGSDRILYQEQFSVSKNDFENYQLVLTGQPFLAYVWDIPVSKVNPGVGTFGTASVIFTAKDGNDFNSSYEIVSIPQLSDEEVKQMYDDQFQKTALVGRTVTNGSFAITLERAGWYEHLEFDTAGDKVTEFRADFTVKNIGSEAQYIPSSFIIIDQDGNQYDASYRSTLGFKEVFPNASVKGMVLFDDLDKNVSHIRLFAKDTNYNISTYEMEDTYWAFELNIP
jgi:hypothetical protein